MGSVLPLCVPHHTVVIVGAGAAGIATAASLRRRAPDLDIAVIDPAHLHQYRPGQPLASCGLIHDHDTARPIESILPQGVRHIQAAVAAFEPDRSTVLLADGRRIRYERLVACPGLSLRWDAVRGLAETLGNNGVTSDHHPGLASYTRRLIETWPGGRAIFTQPAMPFKCVGAPLRSAFLFCDAWRRTETLNDSHIRFFCADAALSCMVQHLPVLMEHVEQYAIDVHLAHALVAVDGKRRVARFSRTLPDGTRRLLEIGFDLLHVAPPQAPHEFVRGSSLADAEGWISVDAHTLQHTRYADVFALGDACSTSNLKSIAAVRRQAPVVAHNLLSGLRGLPGRAVYDGHGARPPTVGRGRTALAEFCYGDRLSPTFPRWLLDGSRPSRIGWLLKRWAMPALYWHVMLKGREWLASPRQLP